MNLVSKKSVNLPVSNDLQYYYYKSFESFNSDWMHESLRRKHMEESVFKKPYTELDNVKRAISSWRKYNICIVFGNLGRQPYLLDYYLDLCFGYEEEIQIFCRWETPSPYRIEGIQPVQNVDFLFHVEPPFGYTIQKPSHVKHLIVLTSHLNLYVPAHNKKYYNLHFSRKKKYDSSPACSITDFEKGEMFEPPIFHDQRNTIVPSTGPILLDVRKSKSANEAYLRSLTGKEMIKNRSFQILMNDRDRKIINKFCSTNEKRVQKRLGNVDWNKKFYCDF